jgi:AcrR family transcriptional regulator
LFLESVLMTRRTERAEETRARILSAARSLFREHGFDATSAEQIASRAGVGKGTVFLHAGSKERLLVMVYQADLGFAVDRALASADVTAPLPQALAGVFGYCFQLYEEDTRLARELIREQSLLPVQDQALRSVTTRLLVGLEMLIHSRQRRDEVGSGVDAALAARTSFGIYNAVLLAWLGGWLPDPAARDAELLAALQLLWKGLAP